MVSIAKFITLVSHLPDRNPALVFPIQQYGVQMNDESKHDEHEEPSVIDSYEAPVIEQIVTAEGLEREVHYAGNGFSGPR